MTVIEQNPDLVYEVSADDYWNRYQLVFALYSVSDRAIPSAYDGLKPGQRRLLTGEDALLTVTVSPTGFTRSGKKVRAEARSKSTVKSAAGGVVPAE